MNDGCRENVIEWITDSKRVTLTLSQRRMITKVERYAKENPDECQITYRNSDGSICAHVPVDWVKISPKRKVTMSEERRAASSQRLSEYRKRVNNTVQQ